MTAEARFVLDANVFIQAHRAYYAFDVCPGYWKALLAHHDGARLCSVDRIRGELLAGRDALSDWVTQTTPEAFFANTDDPANNRLVRTIDGLGTIATSIFRCSQRRIQRPKPTAGWLRMRGRWAVRW
jgi:hypothetical protein